MGKEVRDSHWGKVEDILVVFVVVVVVRVDAVEAPLFSGGAVAVVVVFVKDYLLLPSFPALTQDPAIDQSVGFPSDD